LLGNNLCQDGGGHRGLAPQLKADYHHVPKISDLPAIGGALDGKAFSFSFPLYRVIVTVLKVCVKHR